MGKPLKYVYYTAAGTIECERSEEDIQAHPAFRAVVRPADGRPKLVAALYFLIQDTLDKAAEKPWFWIIDAKGVMTALRPSAISGFRVLETLGDEAEAAQIGFRPSG